MLRLYYVSCWKIPANEAKPCGMETKQTAQFNRFFALFLSLILFRLFLFSVCVPRAEALTCFVRWSTSARKKKRFSLHAVSHCTTEHFSPVKKTRCTKERERTKMKQTNQNCCLLYMYVQRLCTTYTAETSYRGYRLNQIYYGHVNNQKNQRLCVPVGIQVFLYFCNNLQRHNFQISVSFFFST